jgi:parallel beta-helix repeat protein
VENVGDGIWLQYSSNSCIVGNDITSNEGFGIVFGYSSNCSIIGNNITNNEYDGIWCRTTSNSTISQNNIIGNKYAGIFIPSSSNRIFHNNFVNNSEQVSLYDSANVWDDGYPSGGNYWSDYEGEDSIHDGVGDTPYTIDGSNIDHYPLMGMFSIFNTSFGSVGVVSNSTIDDFEYFELNNTIKMYVSNTTANQTFGFCRISIPHLLMTEPYHVIINGSEPYFANYTLYDNGADSWIYFSYEHSTLEVVIVPEFPCITTMALFLMTALFALIVHRRKHP